MVTKSKIEWTDMTWNPVTGCSKVSPGCKHCYAERMAKRLKAMGVENYQNGFRVTLHHDLIRKPLEWQKPRVIFVNSMSDLFHEDVPFDFLEKIFITMKKAHWHRFQILTKRETRLAEVAHRLNWPDNVWMGVSVESDKYVFRIDKLRQVPARIKFLSIEPLLGPIPKLDLRDIQWVIVGGESGPGARPMKKDWVLQIRDQCVSNGVPFFFKQWGGVNKKKAGRLLEGKIWDQMPDEMLAWNMI